MSEPVPLRDVLREFMRQLDPEASLQCGLLALATGDLDEARLAISDYRAWRQRGGYEPSDGDRRADQLERLLLLRRKTPKTT